MALFRNNAGFPWQYPHALKPLNTQHAALSGRVATRIRRIQTPPASTCVESLQVFLPPRTNPWPSRKSKHLRMAYKGALFAEIEAVGPLVRGVRLGSYRREHYKRSVAASFDLN